MSVYVLDLINQAEENMKHIWLGQGGLLLISGKLRIVIDPYLSNSMRSVDRTMKRKVKIKRRFLKVMIRH